MKNLLFVFFILTLFFGCEGETDSSQMVEDIVKEIQPKDFPLIFRRTTLIVRDIEKSLALYRDAIGMEIIYDQVIRRPHPFKEGQEQSLRLIFLKAADKFQGVLGLIDYEYGNEDKPNIPVRKEGFVAQNVVLLFNSNDLEARFAKVKTAPDVEIISEPKLTEYPTYDGKGILRVNVSKFYDPDGFIVEFNQLLDNI